MNDETDMKGNEKIFSQKKESKAIIKHVTRRMAQLLGYKIKQNSFQTF